MTDVVVVVRRDLLALRIIGVQFLIMVVLEALNMTEAGGVQQPMNDAGVQQLVKDAGVQQIMDVGVLIMVNKGVLLMTDTEGKL